MASLCEQLCIMFYIQWAERCRDDVRSELTGTKARASAPFVFVDKDRKKRFWAHYSRSSGLATRIMCGIWYLI